MMTTPSTARLVAPQGQRFGDGGIQLEVVPLDSSAGEVAFGKLVDEDRRHVDPRLLPAAPPTVAERQAIQEVLRMRMNADLGAEEGDPLPLRSPRHEPCGSIAQAATAVAPAEKCVG